MTASHEDPLHAPIVTAPDVRDVRASVDPARVRLLGSSSGAELVREHGRARGVTIDPTWALLIGILAGVGVAAIAAVAFTLVPTLRQLQRTAAALEAVARKVEVELDPTIHEAKGLVRDVATLTRRVDGDLKVVSRIVEDVSDTTAYAKQLAAAMKTGENSGSIQPTSDGSRPMAMASCSHRGGA